MLVIIIIYSNNNNDKYNNNYIYNYILFIVLYKKNISLCYKLL